MNRLAQIPQSISYSRESVGVALVLIGIGVTVFLASLSTGYVREDVMWLDIIRNYSPIDASRVLLEGIQSEFRTDFPHVDWPYRPVEHLFVAFQIEWVGDHILVFRFIKTILLILTLLLLYRIVRELIDHYILAIFAIIVAGFSVPMLLETWWFHHIALLFELFFLIGIFSYLKYTATKNKKWIYLLWISSFVAPLLAEAGLFLPVIILIVAVLNRQLDNVLVVPLPFFVLLAIFPALIPHLLLEQTIVTDSIFGAFSAGAAVREGLFSTVQTRLPYLTLGFVTPTITVIAIVGLLLRLYGERDRWYAKIGFGAVVVTSLGLVLGYPPPTDTVVKPDAVLSSVFPVVIAVLSLRFGFLVPIWFIVSYLPFGRVVHLSVNLIPPAIPWIIMMFLWIHDLLRRFKRRTEGDIDTEEQSRMSSTWPFLSIARPLSTRPKVYYLVWAGLVIGLLGQVTYVEAARTAWGGISGATRELGSLARENFQRDSVIIGERDGLLEAFDVGYYSGYHSKTLVIGFGPTNYPGLAPTVRDEDGITKLLEDFDSDVYLLIQDTVPGPLYHYIWDNRDRFEFVDQVDVSGEFTSPDPLFWMLPDDMHLFIGLEFLRLFPYRQNALHRELLNSFKIYKYLGGSVVSNDALTSDISVERYKNFDIYLRDGRYFGLPASETPPDDFTSFGDYSSLPKGLTLSEVKLSVDVNERTGGEASGIDSVPHLVTAVPGLNVVRYLGDYYAVPPGEGVFDPKRFRENDYSRQFRNPFLESLLAEIDSSIPLVIEEDYKGFELVAWKGKFFAAPRIEGPFDLQQLEAGDYTLSFEDGSLPELRGNIDSFMGPTEFSSHRGFTLFRGREKYFAPSAIYAVPETPAIAPSEISVDQHVISAETVTEAQSLIDRVAGTNGIGHYRGYDIYNDIAGSEQVLCAVPESMPAPDSCSVSTASVVTGSTIIEIKTDIDQRLGTEDDTLEGSAQDSLPRPEEGEVEVASTPPPVLVEEGYKGYNIIGVGERLYAIQQSDGAFDLARFQSGGYENGVEALTIEEIRQLIDERS